MAIDRDYPNEIKEEKKISWVDGYNEWKENK